ncbi:MAG: hypothetical protein ABSB22_12210 [Thermodesulfobacteriota bacterium]
MHEMNQHSRKYRVLLIGVGDNTEAKKELFCKNLSEKYGISLPLLKEIVDRCPIVLKKNLSQEKAVALAKTLQSFGAMASVEEKRDFPAIFLEFQEIEPCRLALESSSLRKAENGAWSVTGRVKNISDENLSDTWALVQLFDDVELLTFDEVSIPINPLPPGAASPFRLVFEGNLPIQRISIAFKNSSGHPLSATDRRKKREWVEVEVGDRNLAFPSSSFLTSEDEGEPRSIEIAETPEEVSMENHSNIQRENDFPSAQTLPLTMEGSSQETISEPEERGGQSTLRIGQEADGHREEPGETLGQTEPPQPPAFSPLEEGKEERVPFSEPESHTDQPQNISDETPSDAPGREAATPSMEGEGIPPGENGKGEKELPIPWIEEFRSSIETYYEKPRGIFFTWFKTQRKGDGFSDSFHCLLTILLHARFDQMSHSEKALENTQRVFKIGIRPDLELEQIPPLEGTEFFSAENWRVLFHRAIPKLQQATNNILEKGQWDALDLERLIQVIPHMSDKNSRMAVRWIDELIPETVAIDFSNTRVSVEESLYRVACRLGVVDPNGEVYQGEDSISDLKIQSFAKAVFPKNPLRIEEPMTWVGRKEEGGHCFPTQPRCNGCLFETFCPRLHPELNPSEIGLKRNN